MKNRGVSTRGLRHFILLFVDKVNGDYCYFVLIIFDLFPFRKHVGVGWGMGVQTFTLDSFA